jgi:serine protease Do
MAPRSEAQALSAPPPMNSAPLSGPVDAGTFRGIAHDQSPMVVSISTTSTRTSDASDDQSDELFRRFFGTPRQQPDEPQESTGAGTGFIIDNGSGLILTNNHVVEHATKIRVQLYGEEGDEEDGHEAKVVGRDPLTDSALIELVDKAAAAKMPQARFGDSSQMQPGDWVVAIGNPFRYNHTVTVGVISGLSRPFDVGAGRRVNMLQTDAAINPGNSGGPLLNVRGEVVGINTAILSNRMANIGIGFAVPINLVRELLPQLRTGKVTRGKIGVTIMASRITQEDAENWGLSDRKGAVVREVERGGPAAKAGLRPGDVVVEYNGRKVENDRNLVEMVVVTKPGTAVPVKVMREKAAKTLTVTVAELTIGPAEAPDVTASSDLTSSFGLQLEDLTPALTRRLQLPADASGAVVSGLRPRGPAGRAGLSELDVIVKVGNKEVASADEAATELERVQPGRSVGVHVLRARGSEMFATIRREP